MSWQRRLFELACAGGAATGCVAPGGPPCGNANPDPCICGRMPATSMQCVAEKTCKDNGGAWEFFDGSAGSGSSTLEGHCQYPNDGGVD